jgi:hypothetical protein
MTDFAISPEVLRATIAETLGAKAKSVTLALGEVTVVVGSPTTSMSRPSCAMRPVAASSS